MAKFTLTTKHGIHVNVDEDIIIVRGGPHAQAALGWALAYGCRLSQARRQYSIDAVEFEATLEVLGVFEDALADDVRAYVTHGEPPINPNL
jgi:hypothetical protein